MTTEDKPNELWQALGREVSSPESRAPKVSYQAVAPPNPRTDRFLLACLSGYLPVVLLCLAWTVMLCYSSSRGLVSLFSSQAFLMLTFGAAISHLVFPVLWKGDTLQPVRLLPLGLALLWTLPLANLFLCLGRSDLDDALQHISSDLFEGTHQVVLPAMLVFWLALAAGLRWLQRRHPWYDPIPPRRSKVKLGLLLLLLPLVANVAAAVVISWSVPEDIRQWEAEVIERQGKLRLSVREGAWSALLQKARGMSSSEPNQQIRELEKAALELLEKHPPLKGDEYNSEEVFRALLGRRDSLASPILCQAGLLECQLRANSRADVRSFNWAMDAFLGPDGAPREGEMATVAQRLRYLEQFYPSSLDELDHRFYSDRFSYRDYLDDLNHWLWPALRYLDPATLGQALSTRSELDAWLAQRAAYLPGGEAAGVASIAETLVKPRLKLYEVLCELRSFREKSGEYPDTLQAIEALSDEDLSRFEYHGTRTRATLVDRFPTDDQKAKTQWELK